MTRQMDIDGEWLKIDSPTVHYGKRLSTLTAWHVFDPQRLREVSSTLIRDVELQLSANQLTIHYGPNLELHELGELRELLNPEGPLAAWRAATIAIDLAGCLLELHELDLPQMLIHPGRIGRFDDRIVLAPTLPGALPPLPQALPGNKAGWIHYVAPEVLRTRALDRDLLFQGDIFSLGRTLEALSLTIPMEVPSDPFELAVQRVETVQSGSLGILPAGLTEFRQLITRMCAIMPERRPGLPEIITELQAMAEAHSPEQKVRPVVIASGLDADALLRDFREACEDGVFHVNTRRRHIVTADALMLQSPPDCGRAVLELEEAESSTTYEADVQLRLGRVYSVFTNFAGYLTESAQAYQRAARLSNWDPQVIEKWLSVLSLIEDPGKLLSLTQPVPSARRTAQLVHARVAARRKTGDSMLAWYEIADYLSNPTPETGLIELARLVAKEVQPLQMQTWLRKVARAEAYTTAREIAVKRLADG